MDTPLPKPPMTRMAMQELTDSQMAARYIILSSARLALLDPLREFCESVYSGGASDSYLLVVSLRANYDEVLAYARAVVEQANSIVPDIEVK